MCSGTVGQVERGETPGVLQIQRVEKKESRPRAEPADRYYYGAREGNTGEEA